MDAVKWVDSINWILITSFMSGILLLLFYFLFLFFYYYYLCETFDKVCADVLVNLYKLHTDFSDTKDDIIQKWYIVDTDKILVTIITIKQPTLNH